MRFHAVLIIELPSCCVAPRKLFVVGSAGRSVIVLLLPVSESKTFGMIMPPALVELEFAMLAIWLFIPKNHERGGVCSIFVIVELSLSVPAAPGTKRKFIVWQNPYVMPPPMSVQSSGAAQVEDARFNTPASAKPPIVDVVIVPDVSWFVSITMPPVESVDEGEELGMDCRVNVSVVDAMTIGNAKSAVGLFGSCDESKSASARIVTSVAKS